MSGTTLTRLPNMTALVALGLIPAAQIAGHRDHNRRRECRYSEEPTPVSEFQRFRRTQIAEMRPYEAGETLSNRVSVSAPDREAGSPKPGDMIARNPANHDDQWLVAAAYFAANFEPLS